MCYCATGDKGRCIGLITSNRLVAEDNNAENRLVAGVGPHIPPSAIRRGMKR